MPICPPGCRRSNAFVAAAWVVHRYANQAFCSAACAHRFAEIEAWSIARAGSTGPPRCKYCNSYMEVDQPNQAYCNSLCMGRAHSMAAADRADAELGAKIAAARFARGLTQTQLARRAGVDRTYITAIEGGDLPGSEDVRQQILNILELTPKSHCQRRPSAYACGVASRPGRSAPASITAAPTTRSAVAVPGSIRTATRMRLDQRIRCRPSTQRRHRSARRSR